MIKHAQNRKFSMLHRQAFLRVEFCSWSAYQVEIELDKCLNARQSLLGYSKACLALSQLHSWSNKIYHSKKLPCHCEKGASLWSGMRGRRQDKGHPLIPPPPGHQSALRGGVTRSHPRNICRICCWCHIQPRKIVLFPCDLSRPL